MDISKIPRKIHFEIAVVWMRVLQKESFLSTIIPIQFMIVSK